MAADSTVNIDVVLLDIQMPILSGFEVCKQLKMMNQEIRVKCVLS